MRRFEWRMVPLRLVLCSALAAPTAVTAQDLVRLEHAPAGSTRLPMRVGGRVESEPGGFLSRQWPGTYFETSIHGSSAFFRVGYGEVSLRISVDGKAPVPLVRPAAGFYRIGGLSRGVHRLRVQVASESQSAPTEFGGFFAPAGVSAAALATRSRQIEFIGDSHTVGYGNTSPKHECTDEEVWRTTDTTLGVPAEVASRHDADYQVNAISGRGIVRNYNGFAADPLPEAYPYILFDKAHGYSDPHWNPQLIVVSLGTNDFSTPLKAGEKWPNREQLQSDYESTFVRFLMGLHSRSPRARFLLWAANPTPEIGSEIQKVVKAVKSRGVTRIDFVPVEGLAMSACNFHPSVADDSKIAAALDQDIDAHADVWSHEAGERR